MYWDSVTDHSQSFSTLASSFYQYGYPLTQFVCTTTRPGADSKQKHVTHSNTHLISFCKILLLLHILPEKEKEGENHLNLCKKYSKQKQNNIQCYTILFLLLNMVKTERVKSVHDLGLQSWAVRHIYKSMAETERVKSVHGSGLQSWAVRHIYKSMAGSERVKSVPGLGLQCWAVRHIYKSMAGIERVKSVPGLGLQSQVVDTNT